MTYAHLYRDKYVERISRKDPRQWIPVYTLVSDEYVKLECPYEAERRNKMRATADKCMQIGTTL